MSANFTVKFESDHFSTDDLCNQIEIEICVSAPCEDDYSYDIESIHDATADCERKLEDFPKEEQAKIEKLCEAKAYDEAYNVYQGDMEAAGDRAYDAWKDRQMEEGE